MKALYLAIGFLTFGLGAVGAFLPILPTTPFLLVSAYCFARGSEKVDAWFKSTNLYKNNLESFVRGDGMTKATKLRIMTMVTLLMAFGFMMMSGTPIGRICLAVVWVAHVIAFTFFIKTAKEEV